MPESSERPHNLRIVLAGDSWVLGWYTISEHGKPGDRHITPVLSYPVPDIDFSPHFGIAIEWWCWAAGIVYASY